MVVALFLLQYPDEPYLEDVTVALRLPHDYGDSPKEAHATILRLCQSNACMELTDTNGEEWWVWPETVKAFATLAR
jgi:hypothetical protein